MAQVRVTVDGVNYSDDVEPRTLLVHYLREQLGKVGTVVGCDTSNCGACTVHLDGEAVKARRRKEDARLITGKTTWTDNMVLPGMLHIAVVRSPVAHAKITNVDVSAAQQAPGVIAVFTGRDFA